MSATRHTERGQHPGAFQIDEDLNFQKRMWRIERIGWWGIAAILLAAAIGLFGHGPASRGMLHMADLDQPSRELVLDYERFGRAHSESQFIFSSSARRPESGMFSLWLSGDYLRDVEVLRITPDPASQDLVSDGVRYHFHLQDGPQTVIFRFKPERAGHLSGSFRLNDGPRATFHQWLFP